MDCVSHGQRTRQGFTLVELLVVIAIIIILLALLIPTVSNALASRSAQECANRLRQVGIALEMARSDGKTIQSDQWATELVPFLGDEPEILFCPDDDELVDASSYALNTRAHRFSDLDTGRIVALDYRETAAKLVVDKVGDQDDWSEEDGLYAARHLQGINTLLHSGAVKPYKPEDIDPRVCELWKRYWRPHSDKNIIELDACVGQPDPPREEKVYPEVPFSLPEPNYPPTADNECGEMTVIADDTDSTYFSTSYDTRNDYDDFVELWPGFSILVPGMSAAFKSLQRMPEGAVGLPYGGNHRQAEGHQLPNSTQATFTFPVDHGKYYVWAHWFGAPIHSDATPVEVRDGENAVGRETLNQKVPSGQYAVEQGKEPLVVEDGDNGWYLLGEYEISSGTLNVIFSAAAGAESGVAGKEHLVVADAVRISCSNVRQYHKDRCFGDLPDPVDNGGTGYSEVGDWQTDSPDGVFGDSHAWTVGGNGNKTATYEISDVVPGEYRVWTRFVPKESQATNTPFTIYDGPNRLETVPVNQAMEYLGVDLDKDGVKWYELGSYDITSDSVVVEISDNANGIVIADAVRIECAYSNRDTGCPDDSYDGRACRKYYAEEYGATDETEKAVEDAMNWISRHQFQGGYWSFQHQSATCPYLDDPEPCDGSCPNEGKFEGGGYVAATGMALLPFLGAGFGPEHPKYGRVVAAGINYLLSQVSSENGTERGSLGDGYHQGMGSLALLEAVGVCRQGGFGTVDQARLEQAAVDVVTRIVICQHDYNVWPDYSGGWRYGCAGWTDMSVSSWMVQSLKAATAVGIDYEALGPLDTMLGVRRMLNSLSGNAMGDPAYGKVPTMFYYLGWPGNYPTYSLSSGASPHIGRYLSLITGSSPKSIGMMTNAHLELERISGGMERESYKNYYTTQFLRHMGGEYWTNWEEEMKKLLLEDEAPETEGHVRGSWHIGDTTHLSHNCGRLWETVAASMTLEVYYRHAIGQ